jgi:hypothetical protein
MATKKIYLIVGLSDATAVPTRTGFDIFFEDREYSYHIEFGWVPSFEQRFFDKIDIFACYQDERKKAQIEKSKGLAFTFTKFISDRWMP